MPPGTHEQAQAPDCPDPLLPGCHMENVGWISDELRGVGGLRRVKNCSRWASQLENVLRAACTSSHTFTVNSQYERCKSFGKDFAGGRLRSKRHRSFCHFATASWEERGCTIMDPVPSCPLEPLPQEYILSTSRCHHQPESENGLTRQSQSAPALKKCAMCHKKHKLHPETSGRESAVTMRQCS